VASLERTASDLLAAYLGEYSHLRLVNRERLTSITEQLDGQGARETSIAKVRRAASLAGAEIAIWGQAARKDGQLILYAQIAGASGSDVFEGYVSGPLSGPLRPLCRDLARTVADLVTARGGDMVSGTGEDEDPLSLLCGRLAGRALPRLHVSVLETYGGIQRRTSAGGEELRRALQRCGFTIVKSRSEAEVVMYGSATGGSSPRRGDLITSDVRVELRSVAQEAGRLLAVASTRRSAVDLFASLAGAKAFREAVVALAPTFIEETLVSWEGGESHRSPSVRPGSR
jgi:hypothetical protein